jgi:hypothetical protein
MYTQLGKTSPSLLATLKSFPLLVKAIVYTQVGVACSTRVLPPLIPPYKGGKLENLVPSRHLLQRGEPPQRSGSPL